MAPTHVRLGQERELVHAFVHFTQLRRYLGVALLSRKRRYPRERPDEIQAANALRGKLAFFANTCPRHFAQYQSITALEYISPLTPEHRFANTWHNLVDAARTSLRVSCWLGPLHPSERTTSTADRGGAANGMRLAE